MMRKCLFLFKWLFLVLMLPATGMGQEFFYGSLPVYYLTTGAEAEYIAKHLKGASGLSIANYDIWKGEIEKGSNFLITFVKAPFFQLQQRHEKELKDILGKRYDEIVKRLQEGENFYFYDQGRVNLLIICVQDYKKLVNIIAGLFKEGKPFILGALDSDNDGLPDYLEISLGLNKDRNDTDGDGLSDYDEYFKYRTNPKKRDSDADGLPDGDSEERREYAYSIKAVREIYPPFNSDVMNDIFQDVRVLEETKDKLVYEIILYPYVKNIPIPQIPGKKDFSADIKKYVKKTIFCNYSPGMQKEIKGLLNKWMLKDDYETLEFLAGYAQFISKYYPKNDPIFFYIEVVDRRLNYLDKGKVDAFKNRFVVSDAEVLSHLVYGDSMFYNRMHGTCGSVSVYMATILRAAGIPTRIVSATPIIDASDNLQVELLKGLRHEGLKRSLMEKASKDRGSFVNHFFNEACINGRWLRVDLNNVNVGPYAQWFGLLIKENAFADFNEVNFARTWGKRIDAGQGNPYKTLRLSDQFPKYLPDND